MTTHLTIATTNQLEKPIIELYSNEQAAEIAKDEIQERHSDIDDLEMEVYWDEGEQHTALVDKVVERNEDGDVERRERADRAKADSEEEIMEEAENLMEKYPEGDES